MMKLIKRKDMFKKNKKTWFIKVRGSYLPSAWQGMLIYLWYVVYLITVPVVWYVGDHTLWQLLTTVIPLIAAAALLTQYIASKHAR